MTQTNGLEMGQPCNTPPSSMNLTPSPNHHPHNTMTPPPTSHLMANRNLSTPPASAQMASLQYHHKYYSGNLNVTPPIAINQNTGRPPRNGAASAPSAQHMGGTSPSRNVSLSSNLMSPYGSLNGYRMSQQPGYSAAGFINNPSQLQMAGVMNMQQYPSDSSTLQRAAAAQQNSMYSTYPYISLNANPMRR